MGNLTIAIDGPAGAGKSTVAKAVAKELNLLYLDTGAMYRTCGLACVRENVARKDVEAIIDVVSKAKIEVKFQDGEQLIFLNDEDVSQAIRTPEISVWASDVSAIPEVRLRMVELQREIAEQQPLVMDGRDIGTYVLPDAECKIFLTAHASVRAKRRHLELVGKGDFSQTEEEVLADIEYRDAQDSCRAFAPLKQAEDAILLDSSELTADEVIARVLELAKAAECDGIVSKNDEANF